MWHDVREDMGYHIMLSGSALRALAAQGQDSLQVLRALNLLGARCSRIDLAIDVFGSTLNCTNLCKPNRKPYKGRGRTPKFTLVGDVEDGWTIYVGSRSSEKFLRVYDKAKEAGYEDGSWVRVEMECKGSMAHYLGAELSNATSFVAYQTCSSLVRTLVDFDVPDWSDALAAHKVEISLPKKTERDTFGWLIKACAPALAKEIARRPSEDVVGEFWNALRRELYHRGVDT